MHYDLMMKQNQNQAPSDKDDSKALKSLDPSYSRARKDTAYFMKHFLNFVPRVDQMPILSALEEGARRIVICKGRRYGGTKITSAIAITLAAQIAGLKVGIFAPGWDETEVFMDQVREHLDRSRILNSIVDSQKMLIRFSNGSVLMGRVASKTSQGKRGRGYDLEIFTEGAFIPDDEMHVIRLAKLDNPKAIEIQESSPNGLNHFWRDFNDPDFISFHRPTRLNPLVSKTELAKERSLMTALQASQELDAEFIDDTTSPFPQVLIDEAVKTSEIEKLWTHKEHDAMYVAGVDLGRKRDRSVCFIWKVNPKGDLQAVHIKEFTYDPNDPRFWCKVIDHCEYLAKEYKMTKMLVDCTGLGDKVVMDMKLQFAEHEINTIVEGFNFSYSSKNKWEGLVNQLSLKFERYLLHFPFHLEFIKQLKSIRFNSQRALYEAIGKSPDIVMAAALGVKAAPEYSNLFHTKANERLTENEKNEEKVAVSYN